MKIKILYIISDKSFGGGSRHLFDLITNLDKNFTPILISIPSPIFDRLKGKIQTYRVEMNSRWDLKAVKNMQNIIEREKPDIIHLHSTRAGILGTMSAKKYKIPLVYTEHLFTNEYIPHSKLVYLAQSIAFKRLAKNIDKVIAVSQSVKDYFVAKNIFPKEKIEVIYHGVERSYQRSVNSYQQHKNKTIKIGSIGTLTKIKGYEYLIGALKIVNSMKIENWKLEILGKGSEKNKLEKLISKYQLQDKVKLLDFVDNPGEHMAKWDIYVQPSLSESFGLALAEAMAIGLPVIATKTGGMPELVGDAGLLIPAKNEIALKDAIIKLVNDSKLRIKLGKLAASRIKKYFSLKNMVLKTEKLYKDLLC